MDPLPLDSARIARELKLTPEQVTRTVALLDEGNTVPFITRYRKEQTGNLDEEQIRAIQRSVKSQRQIAERAAAVLRLIEAQGKMTPALRAEIEQADSLKRLEDLYLPYRPKRRSRAEMARERGVAPLAERIWSGAPGLGELSHAALAFIDAARELPDADAVLAGAADILAERVSELSDVREAVRTLAWRTGRIVSTAVSTDAPDAQPYRDYFDYAEDVARIPPHRVLALNRGEAAKAIRIKLDCDEPALADDVARRLNLAGHPQRAFLRGCVTDALERFLLPGAEREIRRDLTERAERHAVGVFARNLRNLLLQPPLRGRRVLAVDPGLRTGCKTVVLDELGRLVAHDVVFLTGSDERRATARRKLAELMQQHDCRLVAIGNGTACRETEELVAETIATDLPEARYVIVNEAGASIYSASPAGRDEFPDLDATVRGTISIGRRLQDPLSELVKIDPQHLGVGMYQHDVSEKDLRESLDEVIESCVNYVGVDLNRASAALLRHVSGFNQLIARRVVEWREQHGGFTSRRQLLDVPGIGAATFTQAAGFLKVVDGDEPLDATWIHPESYDTAQRLLAHAGVDSRLGTAAAEVRSRLDGIDPESLGAELGVGVPTLRDLIDALKRPGRDPRADLAGPIFKQGILTFDDLEPGMELRGTVLNVVDFGAFVDVGLKDSGLVHISRMSTGFVRSPHDVVSLGDVVTVWVEGVDRERRRLSLTMVPPGVERNTTRNQPNRAAHPAKPVAAAVAASRPAATPRLGGQTSAAALTPRQEAGQEPLRGFDELKRLWGERR